MRRSYEAALLTEESCPENPLELFGSWIAAAGAAGEPEPNAMALATVSGDGQPHVRFVLLKYATDEGFVFFTNYASRKGDDLAATPRASLAFWWPALERQVRVDGTVTRLPEAASDAYFDERPRGSQIGAWASEQSRPVAGRAELVAAHEAREAEFAGRPVPRPAHWGGYALAPQRLEFWQGRPDRLHDRIEYAADGEGSWVIRRLAP